ncbi:MAG: UDP-N-acetylmuramoyl-tripeptide--D-alanyl-D-alanine ligase [Akkermansiaceae bacterium]|nr:UDP-N-acetylmuramoyl-tripeptide--D-alanyl-D-alanine ligase [Akkermansiaceae bacterium]
MNPITASQLSEILGATLKDGDPQALVSAGVSTDSRKLDPGCAFFALRGERFNGDEFAAAALEAGATVAVVQHWQGGEVAAGKAVIEVTDALRALQRLAYWWRRQLDIPVIGITGSNGKTSTKDFSRAVLARKFKVAATRGNLNNHIGVPLSVLSTTAEHTAAVYEMGMNHAGEITPLCEIAKPQYGIITNIGTAHIENLGSRDMIAEEKGMLARSLPKEGLLFLPATCEYHGYLRERTKSGIVVVGNGRGVVRAEKPVFESERTLFQLIIEGVGREEVVLPVGGRHMVTNALLAAALGWKLGIEIEEIAAGLSETTFSGGRLQRFRSAGVQVIDDSYNANPESVIAAIETLEDFPLNGGGRKFIVLGKMAELGRHAGEAHERIGKVAAERGLKVVAVGEGAEGIAQGAGEAPYFSDFDQASTWLKREVQDGDVVLFKGSRAAAVEVLMNQVFPPQD